MTNIIRSSLNNPCPVCNRTKDEDCSWYADGQTAMCKTYVDGVGHDESKWHYGGVNELGFQGKFVFKTKAEFVKPPRPQSQKEFYYPDRDGNSLVKVTRIDDGNGGKKFYQSHWNSSKWLKGNPDEVKKLIPIYRHSDVRQAIERGEIIFIVEGEAVADRLWELGIAATTTIGGSGGYSNYGNYRDDLKGARLILCPDRDTTGLNYIANFEREFTAQIEGYYLAGSEGLWQKPTGGMDIGDDIGDRRLTKEQILEKVIDPSDYQEAICPKAKAKKKTATNSRFTSSIESGLVKSSFDEDGAKNGNPEYIGNHLEAIACVDNPDNDGAAVLLEFMTFKGVIRRWTMLRSYLGGDGIAITEGLLSRGYDFKRKQKGLLFDYLQGLGRDVEKTYIVTDSSGWVQKSFVLPHKTYGDENLKFRDVEPSPEAITEIKGTLQGWKDNVAARCADNSRLILAIGSSFAAPLLPIADVESGGFHLVGATSQGKTTILSVAASVTGLKTVSSWRTTDNALEGGLSASNHLCLPLDELNQADPRKVGAIVYMLGNGIGKGRSTKDGTNRKSKTWLTLVLSSGETTIGKFMELAGESIKGGQEVRLPNIPAVPDGSKYGCFEMIHGADTAVQFVSALEAAVRQHHGIALDAFLSRLVVDAADPTFAGNISKQVHLIAAQLAAGTIDSAIGRVAKRFALVQVALGLAHKYDLLPFPVEQIEWAISTCFKAWLTARGGDGSIEIKNAIDRIEHLLVTNEFSDRVFTLPNNSDRPVRNLLAYRRVDFEGQTEEFLVPTTVFDREFCDGVNKSELVKELQRLGLMPTPRSDGKATHKRRVKGKLQNFYVFGKHESEGVTGVTGVTEVPEADEVTDRAINGVLPPEKIVGVTGVTPQAEISPMLPPLPPEKIAGVTNFDLQKPFPETHTSFVTPVTPVTPPKTQLGEFSKLKVGDPVEIISTGERGKLGLWGRNRKQATIELDNGEMSDWVSVSDIRSLEGEVA